LPSTVKKTQSWNLAAITDDKGYHKRNIKQERDQKRDTKQAYLTWAVHPPAGAHLIRDKGNILRGCRVVNIKQMQEATSKESMIDIKWERCGKRESIARTRLIPYHQFMFPVIDTNHPEPTSQQQLAMDTQPPEAVLKISNVVYAQPGTYSVWEIPKVTCQGKSFDIAYLTAYHVTRPSAEVNDRLSRDKKLGRLARGSIIQDWLSLPSRRELMAKGQFVGKFRWRDPIEGEVCWVLRGRPSFQRPVEIEPTDYILPYQVHCAFGNQSAGIGSWCYTALAGRQGKVETICGDSGALVVGADGLVLGINIRANLFVMARVIELGIGPSSFNEAHMSHGQGAATNVLEQSLAELQTDKCQVNEYPWDWLNNESEQQNMPPESENIFSKVLNMKEVTTDPWETWPADEELKAAACAANFSVPASVEDIMDTKFTKDNIDIETVPDPPYRNTRDACGRKVGDILEGIWYPNVGGKPRPDLLYGLFLFDATVHGDFVKVLVLRFSGKRGTKIYMTGAAIWDAILLWCDIGLQDVRFACSIALGGMRKGDKVFHRAKSLYWIIPASALSSLNNFSLEKYWASGKTAPFELVTAKTDINVQFNLEAFTELTERYPQLDKQAVHWFRQGINMGTTAPRNSIFMPHHNSFMKQIDFCVGKVNQEREWGCFRPSFSPGPQQIPCMFEPYGGVNPGLKSERKVCDRSMHGAPDFEGVNPSVNAWENEKDRTVYHPPDLPTPLTHAANLGIIMTLQDQMANAKFKHNGGDSTFSETTGFSWGKEAFQIRILCTDAAHMYRQWKNAAQFEGTQQALVHPKGILSDGSGNFGDKLLSGHMQRLGSINLRIALAMVLELLDNWSVWIPGSHKRRQMAGAWDDHPIVLQWRTRRYQMALAEGLGTDEAKLEANPLTAKQYIDDAMQGFIELLVQAVLPTMFKFAKAIGYEISWHKTQLAAPGPRLWEMDRAGVWKEPKAEMCITLGKVFDLDNRVVKDKSSRLPQLRDIVMKCHDQSFAMARPLADFTLQERAIGQAQWVAYTEPAVRGLLQAPIRSLTVRTGLRPRTSDRRRPSGQAVLAPYPQTTHEAYLLILDIMMLNQGVTFNPCLRMPLPCNTLVLQHDAAGAVINEQGHRLPAAESYRGGATLIMDSTAATTEYGVNRWTDTDLELHSSALEMMQGNSGMEDAVRHSSKPNILEIFDSVPATAVCRILAARTEIMRGLAMQRSHIVNARPSNLRQKIFSLWRRRSTVGGQMADSGSKAEWAPLKKLLLDAGMPPLAARPRPLPTPVRSPFEEDWFTRGRDHK
jgi:hypothetical protein